MNDFRDLNGQYGEISSSSYLFDQIYSFQESAFGRLRASDRDCETIFIPQIFELF